MIKHRIFITSTTVAVIFFLTILGMRISFLDKSPKPKPKPRAVLNLFEKSASSSSCSSKQNFAPTLDIPPELFRFHITRSIFAENHFTLTTNPTRSLHSFPQHGRSPPLS